MIQLDFALNLWKVASEVSAHVLGDFDNHPTKPVFSFGKT